MEETVTISRKEYEELLNDSRKLLALEGAGVDNWQGYDDAMETMELSNQSMNPTPCKDVG